MSDTFKRCISRLLLVLFLILAGLTGHAQYTKSALETGYDYTGVASDENGNLYALRSNAAGTKYNVVKYFGGVGAGNIISSTEVEVDAGLPPFGIAVNSLGDVFVTSMNSAVGWEVIKYTAPSYTATKILQNKYITGVAIDKNDNLLTLEWDNNTSYIVRKYPQGNENSAGTTVFAAGVPLGTANRYPTGITVDSRNNIYFTDFPSNAGGIVKVNAPWYTTSTVLATGRSFSSVSVDAFDRFYTTEVNSTTASSIVRFSDSTFTSADIIYGALHNDNGDFPGGVVGMATGKIFATDGTDQELIQLTPMTTQIMAVTGLTANPTPAASINIEVTYSGAVSGVSASAFSLTTTGAITGVSIASITPMAEPNKYVVNINTGTGSGTIRLNANAGAITPPVTNVPQQSVVYTIDKTAPTGTIVINGGAAYTNDANVVLTLTASDALSGVANMRFRVDGGAFTAYEPFATTKNFTIPATETAHTIDYMVTDNAGNGLLVSAFITYDVTPPATPVINAGPPTLTTSTTANFSFGAETGATFVASLDGASYTAAANPLSLTGIADGTHTLSVKAVDRAGNVSVTAASHTWTVDNTAPQVVSVTPPAGAYYRAGQNMDFVVKYNEVVNVTTIAGTPYINIIIGLTAVQVPYIGGTGTTDLTFRYTVQAGENDADGIQIQPLVQNNSGFIRDAATNNASTTLNGVGSTTTVRVNTTIPTATITSTAPTIVNAPFNATVNFSESVTGFAPTDITVTNGVVQGFTQITGSTYIIQIAPTADGTVTVTVPAAAADNIGGNPNSVSNTLSRTADMTAPTVTSVSVPADGYYKAGQNLDFTVTYSEAITINTTGGSPRLALNIGGTMVNATYTGTSGTNGLTFRYTVVVGNNDADGIQVSGLILNSATITDAATNNASTTLNGVASTANVKVNTTIPTVALSTTATTVNGDFTVTATFSEAVTGLTESDFIVVNGTASDLQTTDNITYTVTISPNTNGATTVRLAAGAADNIGTNPSQASNTISVTADFTSPTVTSVTVPTNGYYREGNTLNFTVHFSENVNVNTTGGTPYIAVIMNSGTQPATYTAGSGTNALTFSYTVAAGDDDMDGIELGAGISLGGGGTITDAATNNAILVLNSVANSSGVLVNTTHPTVAISATAPAQVNVPFTATVTFSEAVTGFVSGDITVTNATLGAAQTTDNITYTVLVTPTADGVVSLNILANIAVNIPGNGNQASNTLTRTYDATAPVVASVAVPANGYYKAGQNLDFIVRFNENITINTTGGQPTLSLTIGAATVNATYTGTNGTNGMNFRYTVVAGEQDMDGITVGTLSLNGATIRDAATNNANLTLNSVGATANVRVNTTHPTVTISTTAPALVNAPFTATVTFSEAVTGFASGDITVTNATLAAAQTTDNITYTVLVTPTADGAVSLNIPADVAVNIGDNGNSASNTLSRTYDATAPVVTSVTVPADGYYKAGQQLDFTVNFSEDVAVTGATSTLSLTIGAATVNATYMGKSASNSLMFSYIVLNGQEDMDGIQVGTLTLNGATIQDAATNNANLTLNSIGATTNVKVNTTDATVVLTTPATLVNGAFTVTATFSEAVTGLVAGDFSTTNGNATNLQTADNITYTVTITPTADGAATTVNLPASAAVNIGANPTQASNTLTVNYDATAPTVTSVGVPANGYYKAGQTLTFTVNFSENVNVTGTPSLGVTIGASTVAATYTGGTGTTALTYAYTVVNGDQDMDGITVGTLSLNGGTIRDAASNNANGTLNSIGATTGVFVNTTHPTVTLSTTAPALVNVPFTATITFSEAVTGFVAGDITVTNATLAAAQTTDNITYTVLVTPTTDGAVSLNVPADVAVNIGDNGNSASNTLNLTYDVTAPVVTAVAVPANGYYKAGQTLDFIVRFGEDINVNTTGGTPQLSLTIGTETVTASYTGTNGTNGLNFAYTVVDGDADTDGIQVGTLSLNGSTIKDAATNNANLTLNNIGTTTGVFVNTTHPTVTLSTTAPSLINVPFTATVTFSEAVTGLAAGDITATNATVSNLATTDNITYTVLVTPTADGAVSLNVPADAAVNIGDNGNSASNTLSLTYDATAPVVTSVAVPADGYYKAGDALTFTVRFNENITINTTGGTPSLAVALTTGTVNATYTGTDGTDGLTFSYTVVDGDEDMDGITVGTLTLNGATIKDAATNNVNLTLNNVGNTTNVKVNTSGAVVTLSTTATLVNAPFTVTAVFSEAVSGLTASDFTVTNGTASGLQTTDNITYTVTITPAADGTVTVQLPVGAALNVGNNPTLASNTVTVNYDATAPVVTTVAVPANGYYKAGQQLNFTVTFSEDITVNTTGGTPELSLTIGAATVNASYTGINGTNGINFSYTVLDGEQDMDGITVGTLSLNGATIKDAATNNANLTLNNIGTTTGVFVNTTHPTVTISTTAPAKTNAAFTATITFSEAVTGFVAGDITATNATLSNLATTDNITYTVLVTPTADGVVSLNVPADVAVNIGDNGNQTSNTINVTYDATAPVVTSVSVPANGYYKAGQTLNFTVNFGEDIIVNTTGGTPQLSLTIGTATVTASYTGTNGTTGVNFAYTVVDGDTDVDGIQVGAMSLNGATIKDAATNNANITLNNIGNTSNVFVDATAPVVTSVAVPANGYYKAGDVLNFTVNFSENITAATTGGTPYLTVTLSTGTVRASYTGTAANAVSFSYIVRPGDMDLDGITVGTITLNGGTLKDVATNDADVTLHNIGNTTGVLVHTASPSVTLSTTAPSRVNAPYTVTVAFNEAVTGLATGDFTVTNGSVGSLQTTDNITYTVVVTPAADGAVTIQLPTGTVVNVVGNVNTASNIISLTYDATAPVIATGLAFEVLERSAVGTAVGTVTATEAAGTLQNWTIATDDSNGAFAIDANGNITVKDQAKLNAKANSTVTLTITVSDGLNTSVATPVTVKVLPVNLAPSLDPISDETVCPTNDIHTINLNGASAGEPTQTFSFNITTDKPANFEQLSVSSVTGQVTYQLKTTATGTSTVTVTIQDNGGTANGGVDTLRRSFTITVATLGQVNITSDKGTTISKGDVVNLTATGGTIFKWDNAAGIISGQNSDVLVVRPMENTTYRVTVSNAAGCSNTAEFTLTVIEDFKVEATNLLTPNGDGVNDKWVIRNLDSYPDNELKIYDRAGRMVYTRRNYANEWDGTLNGSPLAEGTYYYILTIQGGAKTAKGYITIIRDRR